MSEDALHISSRLVLNKKPVTLPVMEAFYTLQGEGFHQGKAAYFIRLAGCDVGCFWCDVKESWDALKYPNKKVSEILEEAKDVLNNIQIIKPIFVITGGEPLLYDLDNLTTAIRAGGFQTHLETSGSSPLSGKWDWVCLSPKKFKKPVTGIFEAADELKIVIYNKSDFKWAEENAAKVSAGCKLFLQPEWNKARQITPLIIEYIKSNPGWLLSLQVHKYLGIP